MSDEGGPNLDQSISKEDLPLKDDAASEKDVADALHDPEKATPAPFYKDNIVEWDGPDDPANPQNMTTTWKWIVTICLSMTNFTTTFSSSVFSSAGDVTAREFHVSTEVMVLGTSLYLCGFVVGPFLWGPMSEVFGRKIPLFLGFFIFAVFQIPVGVAQNLETIMLCRFFQGYFGSSAQSITGGALADFWDARQRGYAVPTFSAALVGGPTMGPVVGSFIVQSYLGWRWTAWITLIMAALFGGIALLVVPETHHPTLLKRRADRLRHQTGNWALHAKSEEVQFSFSDIATRYLVRPAIMMAKEPILFLVTLYMAFVFGLLYLTFDAFPISYLEERHWSAGVSSLPFIAVFIGCVCGSLVIVGTVKTRLAPNTAEGRYQETRMILMALGGILLCIGLFWFAWTSFPSINPWPEILSGVPLGMGIMLITIQGMNYVIDCYTIYANSALAANTSVRYSLAAGFPLFSSGMFHNLGTQWAASTLGFIALALIPVPVLFWKYGDRLRKLSKFSMTA